MKAWLSIHLCFYKFITSFTVGWSDSSVSKANIGQSHLDHLCKGPLVWRPFRRTAKSFGWSSIWKIIPPDLGLTRLTLISVDQWNLNKPFSNYVTNVSMNINFNLNCRLKKIKEKLQKYSTLWANKQIFIWSHLSTTPWTINFEIYTHLGVHKHTRRSNQSDHCVARQATVSQNFARRKEYFCMNRLVFQTIVQMLQCWRGEGYLP